MRQVSVAPEPLYVGEYVVRKYEKADAQALVDAVTESCEHLRPWMPWILYEPQSVTQREDLIKTWSEAWDERTEFVMGIFLGDRVVGGTGLHLRGAENTVDIGYWVHVEYLKKGIATQVSQALVDTAFSLWPEIDTVEIDHDEANAASSAIPRSLNFTRVGVSPREPQAPNEVGILVRWEKRRS